MGPPLVAAFRNALFLWLKKQWFMVDIYITIVHGAYKPTYNWGAPSCKGLPIHSLNVDNIPPESSPGAKWLSRNGRIPGSDSFQERRKGGAKLRPHIYHISSCIYIYSKSYLSYIYILDPYIYIYPIEIFAEIFWYDSPTAGKKGQGIRVFQTLHGDSRAKLGGNATGVGGTSPWCSSQYVQWDIYIYDIYIYIIKKIYI